MLPLVLISIFLLTLALLIVGLRGKRIGDEPHCRKCKYNLTGIVSTSCPECGTVLSPQSIGWGLRKFRPIFVIVAMLLFAIEEPIYKIRWVRFVPHSVLVRQAKLGSESAISELLLRFPSFTAGQAQEIADYSLEMRKQVLGGLDVGRLPANHQGWQLLLEMLDKWNFLQSTQRNLYHEQFLSYYADLFLRRSASAPIGSKFLWINPSQMPEERISEVLLAPEQQKIMDPSRLPIQVYGTIPRERQQFDGVGWDMEFDIDRGTWMPSANRTRVPVA